MKIVDGDLIPFLSQISSGSCVALYKICVSKGIHADLLVHSRGMDKFVIAYVDSHMRDFSCTGGGKED
jgi:hypothetical protein